MAVSPLDVQPGVVVEQVVGDGYVALKERGTDGCYRKSYRVRVCLWVSVCYLLEQQ